MLWHRVEIGPLRLLVSLFRFHFVLKLQDVPMATTFVITEKDFVSAQRLNATLSPAAMLSAAGIGVVGIVGSLAASGIVAWKILLVAVVGGLSCGFLIYFLLLFVFIPFRSSRLYRQQNSLRKEYELTFDDEFVYWRSEDANVRIRWSDFIKYKEDNSVIVFYLSDNNFVAIPKRCFEDPGRLGEFRSHLKKIGRH